MEKRGKKKPIHKSKVELNRHLVHFAAGLILIIPLLFKFKIISILITIFFISVLIPARKIFSKSMIIRKIAKLFERSKDIKKKKVFGGSITFSIGSLITLILFHSKIAIAGILVLTLCDGFSSLVGYYFGKYKLYKEKTIEGTLTCLILAVGILIFFINPYMAMIISIILTLVELVSPMNIGKIKINDNLSLPILSTFFIWVIQMLI